MTREIVRLAFIIAGMNNLDICACNIDNEYLNAPCWEKLCTKSGSEFGSKRGYVLLAVIALYVPKLSGAGWIAKLTKTHNSMGYRYTEYEPEVWIIRATIESGTAYYKYMLVYVDDVLHLAKDSQVDMLKLNQVYRLKEYFGTTR